jgi:hypothetical protein
LDDVLKFLETYGIYVVILGLGGVFGYFLSLGIRYSEIALDVWREGARDCAPFMAHPLSLPAKIITIAAGLILTLKSVTDFGNEAYLFGLTAFAIGTATVHNFVGNKDKVDRLLPGIHRRLKLRRGQLRTAGQRDKSDAVATFLEKLEDRYPKLNPERANRAWRK